jgi:hypothetical protein
MTVRTVRKKTLGLEHEYRSERFGAHAIRSKTEGINLDLKKYEPTPLTFSHRNRGLFMLEPTDSGFPTLRARLTSRRFELTFDSWIIDASQVQAIDKLVLFCSFGLSLPWLKKLPPEDASREVFRRVIACVTDPMDLITTTKHEKGQETIDIPRPHTPMYKALSQLSMSSGTQHPSTFSFIGASPLWPCRVHRNKYDPWPKDIEELTKHAFSIVNPIGWYMNTSTKGAYASMHGKYGYDYISGKAVSSAHQKTQLLYIVHTEIEKFEKRPRWRYDAPYEPLPAEVLEGAA